MPPADYVELVRTEIRSRSRGLSPRVIDTIYFGGGTPSLLEPKLLVTLLRELNDSGFTRSPDCEITIEINPATVSEARLITYLDHGINRFSVGAQTFDDATLKFLKREHSARQTEETLAMLNNARVNFSADLLFALPHQELTRLETDLERILKFSPSHISPYCLTVPEGHPLNRSRPLDEIQATMFEVIHQRLQAHGYQRYEISNYAQPGKESRHNMIYWSDESYWGLGLGAHSYLKESSEWGVRFLNPNAIATYQEQIARTPGHTWTSPYEHLPAPQVEQLKPHEALTDFCHTALRCASGLSLERLKKKFGRVGLTLCSGPLEKLRAQGLLDCRDEVYSLSSNGAVVSNLVFRELTFLLREWETAATLTSAKMKPACYGC